MDNVKFLVWADTVDERVSDFPTAHNFLMPEEYRYSRDVIAAAMFLMGYNEWSLNLQTLYKRFEDQKKIGFFDNWLLDNVPGLEMFMQRPVLLRCKIFRNLKEHPCYEEWLMYKFSLLLDTTHSPLEISSFVGERNAYVGMRDVPLTANWKALSAYFMGIRYGVHDKYTWAVFTKDADIEVFMAEKFHENGDVEVVTNDQKIIDVIAEGVRVLSL